MLSDAPKPGYWQTYGGRTGEMVPSQMGPSAGLRGPRVKEKETLTPRLDFPSLEGFGYFKACARENKMATWGKSLEI